MTSTEFIPFQDDRTYPKNLMGWLEKRYKKHKNGHEDTVIAVIGKEQSGKSTFTLRTEFALDKSVFFNNENIDMRNIVFTGNDYRKRLFDIEKSILHDDEAVTHLYSRQAMSPENISCNKALILCGFLHNVQFLLMPSFFSFDSYVRQERIHAVIRIYPGRKFKYWLFTKSKRKLDRINANKSFSKVPCSGRGWWSDTSNTPEFEEFMRRYREREKYYKKKASESAQEEIGTKTQSKKDVTKDIVYNLYKKGNVTQEKIADSLGIRRETVSRWIKDRDTVVIE